VGTAFIEDGADKQRSAPAWCQFESSLRETFMTKTVEMTDIDNDEAIRHRAYMIWFVEGQPHDRAEEHWNRASKAVRQERETADEESEVGTKPATPAK
jgi:hypothetical protein